MALRVEGLLYTVQCTSTWSTTSAAIFVGIGSPPPLPRKRMWLPPGTQVGGGDSLLLYFKPKILLAIGPSQQLTFIATQLQLCKNGITKNNIFPDETHLISIITDDDVFWMEAAKKAIIAWTWHKSKDIGLRNRRKIAILLIILLLYMLIIYGTMCLGGVGTEEGVELDRPYGGGGEGGRRGGGRWGGGGVGCFSMNPVIGIQ
jgi:hypothetical protein